MMGFAKVRKFILSFIVLIETFKIQHFGDEVILKSVALHVFVLFRKPR